MQMNKAFAGFFVHAGTCFPEALRDFGRRTISKPSEETILQNVSMRGTLAPLSIRAIDGCGNPHAAARLFCVSFFSARASISSASNRAFISAAAISAGVQISFKNAIASLPRAVPAIVFFFISLQVNYSIFDIASTAMFPPFRVHAGTFFFARERFPAV